MDLKQYAYHLGSLLSNLQGLEFLVRLFLYQHHGHHMGLPDGKGMCTVPVGGSLPDNAITNYDTLGVLIDKYNAIASVNGESQVDKTITEIRDALAHGRVSAPVPDDTMRLVKFSKQQNGTVTVTFNVLLSEDWFVEQTRRVMEAKQLVHAQLIPPGAVGISSVRNRRFLAGTQLYPLARLLIGSLNRFRDSHNDSSRREQQDLRQNGACQPRAK